MQPHVCELNDFVVLFISRVVTSLCLPVIQRLLYFTFVYFMLLLGRHVAFVFFNYGFIFFIYGVVSQNGYFANNDENTICYSCAQNDRSTIFLSQIFTHSGTIHSIVNV
jgi:hypothetical protein